MSLSFGIFENALSRFMDSIADTKSAWTKPKLVEKWNELMGEPIASQKSDVSIPKKTSVEKQSVDKKPESDRCIFKITRGDKMGEQCTSRSKKDESYCVKHYKPNRETKETEETPAKQAVAEETKITVSSSVLMEDDMKRKQNAAEYEVINGHTLVKGTKVVVNAKKAIIGYLDGTNIIHKQNKETETVQKQFHLSFCPSKKTVDE